MISGRLAELLIVELEDQVTVGIDQLNGLAVVSWQDIIKVYGVSCLMLH